MFSGQLRGEGSPDFGRASAPCGDEEPKRI